MKKFIRNLILFIVALPVFLFTACGEKRVGGDNKSKVSWKCYGIGSTFRNSSGTCELTLREVVATDNINYDGIDYSGKSEYMLVVRADVVFKDYYLDKWGVQFYQHYLNYKNIGGAYDICSIKEDNGFEFALTEMANPKFDFNAEKQTYAGEIFMIFCLDKQSYAILETLKPANSVEDEVQIELCIDDMIIDGITAVKIGCRFVEVKIESTYNIN